MRDHLSHITRQNVRDCLRLLEIEMILPNPSVPYTQHKLTSDPKGIRKGFFFSCCKLKTVVKFRSGT